MTYCFKCPNLHEFLLVRPVDQCGAPAWCPICGADADRDLLAEHRSTPHHPGNWPLLSTAAGVNPEQIPEAMAQAAALGTHLNFAPDGRAIFESAHHRKEVCEKLGLFDRNGGYSDPQKRR